VVRNKSSEMEPKVESEQTFKYEEALKPKKEIILELDRKFGSNRIDQQTAPAPVVHKPNKRFRLLGEGSRELPLDVHHGLMRRAKEESKQKK